MTSNQIRRQFLDFFAQRAHAIVESSPVVPHDDPTLLFTNAGMNQFKPIFLGTVNPQSEFGRLKRAADSQKCIRAGGKHNDLDDVGKDTYHHTFFEMLGNWSFGDYFKKEAIAWAWELLTKVWGVDKSRLHATYFQGDPAEGLEPDSEAASLWRTETDIPPAHIHPGNKKDNFWEMGESGPCGPCSEIHIDLTPDKSGGHLVNAGDARVMEIWNLVFIQFNRGADGKLTCLPAKHVDTGMGFERLCSVLQGMQQRRLGSFSNYDADVFSPIFDAIRNRTGAPPYAGTLPIEPQPAPHAALQAESVNSPSDSPREKATGVQHDQVMIDVSYRVIADHLRCLTFAITDGALPSNEGRGYVLRRILRRAVRYGRQYLKMHEPFLGDLIAPLIAHMCDAFPELKSAHGGMNAKRVAEILHDEETSFGKTLDRGITLFEEAADAARSSADRIPGDVAFRLHDTFGFPIDLTQQMAVERGLTVDIIEYERLMGAAKASSRKKATLIDEISAEILMDVCGRSRFVGYESLQSETVLLTMLQPDASNNEWREASAFSPGTVATIFLEATPLYAEQGGQVGDAGRITGIQGDWEFLVDDTVRSFGAVLHQGRFVRGQGHLKIPSERVGGSAKVLVIAEVDESRRRRIAQNHTATHILNWALREALCPPEERKNPHVQQKGSLVDPDKARFDFSHPKPLTHDELSQIEASCNRQIAAKYTVHTKEVDQKKAREINTLRAVFGETYPDVVRVVSIGVSIGDENSGDPAMLLGNPTNPQWLNHSVEFCGGTHVKNTAEIENFVIISEESVAKGVRRIVGVSGQAARDAESRGQELRCELEALGSSHTHHDKENESAVCLGNALTAFQQRISDAIIPFRIRHDIRDLLAELQRSAKEQEKKVAAASNDAAQLRVAEFLAQAEHIGGVTVVVGEVPAASTDALRSATDWIRSKETSFAVLLASVVDGRVVLLAGFSKDVVVRGIRAGDLIKEICPIIGGKGGGRPDLAQGGGTDVAAVFAALQAGKVWLATKIV